MQSAGEKKKEKAADAEPSMDLADTEALINSVSILCALLLAFTVPMISKTNYNGVLMNTLFDCLSLFLEHF
jgi:hypothetical protein